MRVLATAGALLFLAGAPEAAESRPFTVDEMMKTEGLTEVRFSPRGERILLEHTGAYDSSPNFGWERLWGRDRVHLMAVDVDGGAPRAISPSAGEHLWLGSFSPSGRQAAVGWFDGAQAKAGVVDLATGELRRFDFLISNYTAQTCAFDCPLWISEDSFVHYTVTPEVQAREMSDIVYTAEMTSRWAQRSWQGREPSVKVLGSGAHQAQAVEPGGQVIQVDARTGKTKPLGPGGRYWELSPAPDRRRLATLREIGQLDFSKLTSTPPVFGADKQLALEVFDLARDGKLVRPCEACNVTLGSLRWSPSGRRLFFGTRTISDGRLVHEHYIYDFERGQLERFDARGLPFEVRPDLFNALLATPWFWLDERTAVVRISRSTGEPASKGLPKPMRHEWYAVPFRGAPVLLTGGLAPTHDEKPLEDFVAIRDGRLFLMADGDLWSIGADGRRKNLTTSIEQDLSPWCSVIAYWREAGFKPVCSGIGADVILRDADPDALAAGWLTFRAMKDKLWTGEVVFLNVRTGESARVARPAADAELVTASALAKRAIFKREAPDGDRVILVEAGGGSRELLHFNRHLAGVEPAQPVMLTRREPGDSKDRIDWLLLPPGHQPGDRHPLLVYFYPDREFTADWHPDDLREASMLNQQIPAAEGFAVLFATMRISGFGQSGDPMLEMHEQLVHAAENAVSAGYADPERWALIGHSYGGYGTHAVVSQTDRFKAAVAIAGPVNLTSAYAVGLRHTRATSVAATLPFGVMWSEGGQGRMGVPPWQDPTRYIRNSPLFKADAIKTPLLIVHGDEDFVNVGEAEQMFVALQRQGKDAMLLRYWGEGHVFHSPANIRDLWARIRDWFDRYLDIARDAQGHVVLENHRVKSRSQASP